MLIPTCHDSFALRLLDANERWTRCIVENSGVDEPLHSVEVKARYIFGEQYEVLNL